RIRLLLDRLLVLVPARLIPHFDARMDARKDDRRRESRELFEKVRNQHASRAVDVDFGRASEEKPVEAARVSLPEGQLRDLRRDLPPFRERIDEEAVVETFRHDDFFPQLTPKLRRQ